MQLLSYNIKEYLTDLLDMYLATVATSIIFGSGTTDLQDSEMIPNPEDFVLPPTLRGSPSGFAPAVVDSSNFLKTSGLGYSLLEM